ncbi:Dyp-type peroxidase [Rhodoblastus sp.]|uniref:Dyp-type peroxidase n=1 Tax=Rhodoblastus sp. TaxID=1962975 RepID=UPI003F9DACDD
MTLTYQPGIVAPALPHGRSLSFAVGHETDPGPALALLRENFDPEWGVVGVGEPLVRALGREIPGLRVFPALSGARHAIPSLQHDLWIFLRAMDRGAIFDFSRKIFDLLEGGFVMSDAIDTFAYAGGRDLSGYEDGTANPSPEDSVDVAIAKGGAPFSSFVAVQRWEHDLKRFRAHSEPERDAIIGRRHSDNEEIDDAPESAHVKRAAQETFQPTAFMLRRSQPWATNNGEGLEFIAYAASLDPFEQVLRRMAGLEDGISDALFRFSRPINGAYYWCPPIKDARLDLSQAGV